MLIGLTSDVESGASPGRGESEQKKTSRDPAA